MPDMGAIDRIENCKRGEEGEDNAGGNFEGGGGHGLNTRLLKTTSYHTAVGHQYKVIVPAAGPAKQYTYPYTGLARSCDFLAAALSAISVSSLA